jgi:hypothetical protein
VTGRGADGEHNGPMPVDETELWQRLRALDNPDQVESPAGYHHRGARAQFERLVTRLDTDFGCRCKVDRDMQDASLHGRIEVPAAGLLHPDDPAGSGWLLLSWALC